MKFMEVTAYGAAAVLSFALVLLVPGTSAADKPVDAGVILLLSDEILGNSVEIERPDGTAPPSANAPPAGGVPGGLADGGGDGSTDDSGGTTLADGGDSNDVSQSGFGDGTNAGLGSYNNNSGNEGTDNPNQAPDRD